jgi:phosphoenolpyruvate carboxykinase (GTP)
MTSSAEQWVGKVSRTTHPDRVVWCDGSDAENDRLTDQMVSHGTLVRLNGHKLPNSFLHRSNPQDVARTEHLTFICSRDPADAGPTNNWMSPEDAHARVWPLFNDCMRGRTMYVVPYVMGPPESPYAKVGVEITDSRYVVANMRIMTRMGKVATERLNSGTTDWVRGLHSLGDLSPVGASSATSQRRAASGASGRATAATRCWARSASRFASPQRWGATRAGWPSTCSSWGSKRQTAR